MSKSLRSMLFGTTLVIVQLVLPAAHASAGPFLDWLFGRPIYTYPPATTNVPVAAPVAPGYAAANYGTAAPLTTNYAPFAGTSGIPVTGGYAPLAPATTAPVVSGYAPLAPAG